MANKLRCTNCKTYGDRETFYRVGSLEKVCSEACFRELQVKRSSSGKGIQRSLKKSSGLLWQRSGSKTAGNPIPPATRKRVTERDGGKCRWCGTTNWVELHHVNYRSEGVDHSDHNLITLCKEHHDKAHSDKRKWKPVLLGVLWVQYVEGRSVTVPSFVLRLETRSRRMGS